MLRIWIGLSRPFQQHSTTWIHQVLMDVVFWDQAGLELLYSEPCQVKMYYWFYLLQIFYRILAPTIKALRAQRVGCGIGNSMQKYILNLIAFYAISKPFHSSPWEPFPYVKTYVKTTRCNNLKCFWLSYSWRYLEM